MLGAISVNKGWCSHEVITLQPPGPTCEARGNSGWNTKNAHHLQHSPTPDGVKRLRMRKQSTLALDAWGACQINDFSEPRLLHFLIYRKVLSSLTWDIWLSLISNNLWIFQLPDLLLQKFLYILDPLLDSSEKFLRVVWDAVSQA